MQSKYSGLVQIIREMGSVVVSYSGGADSTLILFAALGAGIPVTSVLFSSALNPADEIAEAVSTARSLGISPVIVESGELGNPSFALNPPDRCFICKDTRSAMLVRIASENGFAAVIDGSNADDDPVRRPGMKAANRHGVRNPLREAGFTKDEIREVSRQLGLSTWSKPASPCLATRFPYGAALTEEGLKMVADAEAYLRQVGIRNVRVRVHDGSARIETDQEDFTRFADPSFRHSVAGRLREAGFGHIAIDLEGYRSGSMDTDIRRNAPASRG